MFGVTLPVPTSWLRIETLRPNPNPSQDFQPISFVAGGLDLVRHVISTPPSISKASLRKVLLLLDVLQGFTRNLATGSGSAGTPYFVSGV